MTQLEVTTAAKILWNYHHMYHPLVKSDCILVLGSYDTRVAEYAADLFLQGYAEYILFSGGFGKLTLNVFAKSEAEVFADIAYGRGVPLGHIFVETASTNTEENIKFSRKLLTERNLHFTSFIVLQKPYMERRAYATFKNFWPEVSCIVSSPPISFEKYPNAHISEERMINSMVGDLQRIKEYPARGFQIPQEIPQDVWNAYESLVKAGYTKHLIKE